MTRIGITAALVVAATLCLGPVRAVRAAESLHLHDDVSWPQLPASKRAGKTVAAAGDSGSVATYTLSGDYDRDLTAPRLDVAQRFYDTHDDVFDFLVVFTDFEFPTGDALAFYTHVRNDTAGIGLEPFDYSASFGSAGRLQGYIDMAAMSRYDFNTLGAGFRAPLDTLTHEIMHRWSVRLPYQDAGGDTRTDLIGRDGSHWSLFADTEASIMYGAAWTQLMPGQWTIAQSRQRLGLWDLYLAGLADSNELAPIGLIRSTDALPGDLPSVGLSVAGTQEQITPAQVIAAAGVRVPSAAHAQKHFDAALLLLLRPGQSADPEQLAKLESFRVAYERYFQAITRGRATIRLHLATSSPAEIVPPAPLPASTTAPRPQPLTAAIEWLRDQQQADGHWQDRAATALRDTATVSIALAAAGTDAEALSDARAWLGTRGASNVDEQGWLRFALSTQSVAGAAALNDDGGAGLLERWASSPVDSVHALASRDAAQADDDSAVARLIGFLRAQQNADGSFGATALGAGRVVLTASAAERLLVRGDEASRTAGARARDWVAAAVDPSAIDADAFSMMELAELAVRAPALDLPTSTQQALLQRLYALQGEDGDWGGSVYTTAVAALALQRGAHPNLVPVAAVAAPQQPVQGESFRLRLRIANRGGQPAAASMLHWYDGDPQAGGTLLAGPQPVRALLAGDEVVVDTYVETDALAGTHTLHAVLDRDEAIAETAEDDNTLQLALTVDPPAQGHDFAVEARDLSLLPAQFERVPSTVLLRGRVRSLATQGASQVLVRAVDVRTGSTATLAETRIDIAATGQTPFELSLPIARPEAHRIRVVVDPDSAFAEAREDNNSAEILLPFGESVDLEILPDTLDAAAVATLGEDTRIRITVANRGTRNAATTTLALERDSGGGTWTPLTDAELTVAAGQQIERSLVWRPDAEGPQSLRLRADPADVVTETDENNNVLVLSQQVVRNDAASLLAIPGSIVLQPDPVLQGHALRIDAGVRNIGQTTSAPFDVSVYRGDPRSGGVLLGSTRVDDGVAAQAERTVSIDVPDYAERGDASLFVHVDAQHEIPEGNEDDNYGIREITAVGLADLSLAPGAIVLTPVAPVQGATVTADVLLSNLGEQASAPAQVRLFELSGELRQQVGDVLTLPALPPGQTHTLQWTWDFGALPETRAVLVQIDFDNLVREFDEGNNEATLVVDTQAGDAFVTEPYFSPNGDGVRDQTRGVFADGAGIVDVAVLDHAGRTRRVLSQLEQAGDGAVSVLWDGRDDRGRVLHDGRYALLARSADGQVRGPARTTLDTDRPMALEAVNSEDGVFRELPASQHPWVEGLEGTASEDHVFAVGHDENANHLMRRGVVRAHVLSGAVEPIVTPQWLDRYAADNDLVSVEPVQAAVLADGRVLIAMHEIGDLNRTLLFVQSAQDIDRPQLVGTLDGHAPLPWIGNIDAQRVLLRREEPSDFGQPLRTHSVLDLATGAQQAVRQPAQGGIGATIAAIAPDGVVYGVEDDTGRVPPLTWMPFDTALPPRELDVPNFGYHNNRRVSHLPGTYAFLVHVRAEQCYFETENEAVFILDARDGRRRRLHGVETPNPRGTQACSRAGFTAEEKGNGNILSLRAFWLERQREAVVIDHAARRVLRFDQDGRSLGTIDLPPLQRSGDYAFAPVGANPLQFRAFPGEPIGANYDSRAPIYPGWHAQATSRIGFESRVFDPEEQNLYVASGDIVHGYSWDDGDHYGDGAIDYLRVAANGRSERFAGRTGWPLLDAADRALYPLVEQGNAAQQRVPGAWPQFIHRNGTMLRHDGRVAIPSRGRTTASWRYASRLLGASPSQTRLQLRAEAASDDRTAALFSTLERLTALLEISSDGRVVQLSGVATDRNFESFQIDWALLSTPDDWNSMIPATREEVRFDDFMTWAPPQAGTYLFRLRVIDRAGNRRDRFASAEVLFSAPISNVRQNHRAISPNGDGVQDALELRFNVLRPTEQRFTIRDQAGRIVFTQDLSFGVADLGQKTWNWDGRDNGGARVPDGRYRAELSSGFVLRVNVDTVAPRIDASLTLPWRHFDDSAIRHAVKDDVPLRDAGPIIDHHVDERFAGQPAEPVHDAIEAADLQGAAWREIDPYALLLWGEKHGHLRQAILGTRDYIGKRFRAVSVDAAGNRSEAFAGNSVPALMLVHVGEFDPQSLAGAQRPPYGRAEEIPHYADGEGEPRYVFPEEAVRFMALDLADGLTELVLDELLPMPDGSAQWTVREIAPALPMIEPVNPFSGTGVPAHMLGHVYTIATDLRGRDPGSKASFRLRGRHADGSEYTSNALEVTIGGLVLDCPVLLGFVETHIFAAKAYLEEPASNFTLDLGRPGNAGADVDDTIYARKPGRYRPEQRQATFGVTESEIAQIRGLHGLAPPAPHYRANAIDGRGRAVASEWIECPPPAPELLIAFTVSPVFSLECDATPTGRIAIQYVYTNLPGGEFRFVVSGPLLPEPRIVPIALQGSGGSRVYGDLELPLQGLPEGGYAIAMEYRATGQSWRVADHDEFFVDRRAPQVRLESPAEGDRICAATAGDEVMSVIAEDAHPLAVRLDWRRPSMQHWLDFNCTGAELGGCDFTNGSGISGFTGHSPIEWLTPAPALSEDGPVQLRAVASDWSGGQTCTAAVQVDLDAIVQLDHRGQPRPAALPRKSWPTIAPLTGGRYHRLEWPWRARERIDVTVQLYEAIEWAPGRARIVGEAIAELPPLPQTFGDFEVIWDGRIGATVASDGIYGLHMQATDDCGNRLEYTQFVEVDATPPLIEIEKPRDGEEIRAVTQPILGSASDRHFDRYTVAVSLVSPSSGWNVLAESEHAAVTTQLLAQWATAGAVGPAWVRLQADDLLGNRSTLVHRVEFLPREDVLQSALVEPALFSPNADGVRDEALVLLELRRDARLTLRVLDGEGQVVRLLLSDEFAPTGALTVPWNGRDDEGDIVADGNYAIDVRAADAVLPGSVDTVLLQTAVDTQAPSISDVLPDGGYARCDEAASFNVEDPHLIRFDALLEGSEGTIAEASGTSSGVQVLAVFDEIDEGAYTLSIEAEDAAGNIADTQQEVLLDCTVPVAELTLGENPVIPRMPDQPFAVTGRASDTTFHRYVLELAPAATPEQTTLLFESNTAVDNGELLQWQPIDADGDYVLTLRVEDLAGNIGEASAALRIDGTPPVARIDAPADGARVGGQLSVSGEASDANFARYRVEIATPANAANGEWSQLIESAEPVYGWELAASALVLNGPLQVRLTAWDQAGLSASALVAFELDTIPPPPLVLSGALEQRRDVRLNWQRPPVGDLAEVRLERNGSPLATVPAGSEVYFDRDVPEGELTYIAIAVDEAGNAAEPSNRVALTVDRTPPDIALYAPGVNERVRALYPIRGFATSRDDDFGEWELAIVDEHGDEQLLRRSPTPNAGGEFAAWDTRAIASETALTVRLRARDTSGNEATFDAPVLVDNQPPAAPTGLIALDAGMQVDVAWSANLEPDLLGYLLYRGGELVGYGGALPADLRPLAMQENAYADVDAPDGGLVYRVYAVDLAGNISLPSEPAGLDRDAGPPDLDIVRPQPGEEFEDAVEVVAQSADRDIAQVAFAYRAVGEADWIALGAAQAEAPWRTTFAPGELPYGEYELRALATDAGGLDDPAPPVVVVRYADLTPPAAPNGVRARADGDRVRIVWEARTEPDLAGYRVERREFDGRWVSLTPDPIAATNFDHTGLASGAYDYRVLALDESDNVSEPSAIDRAHVFALALQPPFTPIARADTSVHGTASQRGGELRYRVTGETDTTEDVAGHVASATDFTLDAVPLFVGSNTIAVRIADADGNISLPAQVSVRRGEIPAPPTGLQGTLDIDHVALAWQASASTDVAGYRVLRNGRVLQQDARLAQPIAALEGATPRPEIVDQQPTTAWTFAAPQATAELQQSVQLHWDTPALLGGLRLAFLDAQRAAGEYRIYAASEYGDWMLLATRTQRTSADERVTFDVPYLTDTLRIDFTRAQAPSAQIALSELEPLQRGLLDATAYDETVADGRHAYTVTASSAIGFESAPSDPWSVDVGDVEPPPAVTLDGSVDGDTATLQWSESSATDLFGYAILRDGERIGQVAAADPRSYVDAELANGSYVYTVVAEDEHFNASAPSNAVTLDVAVDGPGQPQIDSVLQEGDAASLRIRWSAGEGSAATSYRLFVSAAQDDSQQPYLPLLTLADTTYLHQGLQVGRRYWYRVQALDARGNASALSEPAGAEVRDLRVPLAPSLTYPTRPGRSIDWYEPEFRVCGFTSPAARVTLARDLVPLLEFDARAATAAAEIDFAPAATHDAWLTGDGQDVFLAQIGGADEPGWFDVANGRRVSPAEGNTVPLHHTRMASRDGSVVGWNAADGWLLRYYRNQGYPSYIEQFDAVHDLAIDADGVRLLVLADRGGDSNVLYVQRGDGGVFEPVTLPPGHSVVAGSLQWQGLRALFADDTGTVHAFDMAPDAVVQPIGAGATFAGPLPAPDGPAWLAIDAGTTRVLRHDADNATPTVLLDDGRLPLAAAWSPDARAIALRFADTLEMRDAITGALQGTLPQPSLSAAERPQLQWSASWRLLQTSAAADRKPEIIDLAGTFCSTPVAAIEGSNLIEGIAESASGLLSPAAEPIDIVYQGEVPNGLPDLAIDNAGFLPAAARLGEPRSLFLTLRNGSDVRAQMTGVYLRATLRLPDGSERTFERGDGLDLASGQQRSIAFDLGAAPAVGAYSLRIAADPELRLEESDETNNLLELGWEVRAGDLPYLALAAERSVYAQGERIEGHATVVNPGGRFDGEVLLEARDGDGGLVQTIARLPVAALSYAQQRTLGWSWTPPADLLAGDYRIRAQLVAASGDNIDTREIAVTLLGDAELALVLQPQQARAQIGTTMPVQIGIDYLRGNRMLSGGTLRLRARTPAGGDTVVWQGSVGTMLPGYRLRRSVPWGAAQQQLGINTLRLTFEAGNVAQALERDVELVAANVDTTLRGEIDVLPQTHLLLGAGDASVRVSATNPGDSALAATTLRLRVLPEGDSVPVLEETWTADLAAGGSFSQEVALAEFASRPAGFAARLDARLPGDAAGQWRTLDTVGFRMVDGEAPQIALVAPDASVPYRMPASIAARIVDRHSRVKSAAYRVDGGEWRPLSAGGFDGYEALLHGLADGEHRIALRARDVWDNEASLPESTFVIDSTPPQIVIANVEHGGVYRMPPIPSIAVEDAHADGFEAWLDGRIYVPGTPVSAEGTHRLEVRARDRAGNRSDRRVDFVVDGMPPALAVVSPVDGSETALDAITVLVASEAGAHVTLEVGAFAQTLVADASGEAAFAGVPLQIGPNTLRARAVDAASNEAGPVESQVVRTAMPGELTGELRPATLLLPHGQDLALDIHVLNGTSEDRPDLPLRLRALGADDTVLYDETLQIALPAGASDTLARTLPSAAWAWGPVTLLLETDGSLLDSVAMQIVDIDPPVLQVESPAHGSVLAPPLQLVLQATDARAVTEALFRIDDGEWLPLAALGNDRYGASVDATDGAHRLRFRARDAAGNTTESGDVDVVADATPPQIVVAGIADGAVYTQAVMPVITVLDANPQSLTLELDGQPFVSGSTVGSHGSHRLTAVAVDAAGHRSERSIVFALDLEAPGVVFVQPQQDTIVAADSVLVLGSTEADASVTMSAGSYETDVIANASGLFSAGAVPLQIGENLVQARATDAAGNAGPVATLRLFRSADGAGGLVGAIAATPPQVAQGDDVTLVFDVGERAGLARSALLLRLQLRAVGGATLLFEQERSIALAAGADYADTLVVDGESLALGDYIASLEAQHEGVWLALASNTVEVVDAVAPDVVLLAPASGSVHSGDVDILAQAIDAGGIARVQARVDGGIWQTMTASGNDRWSLNAALLREGTLPIEVRAEDMQDNVGAPVGTTIRSDATPPQITVQGVSDGQRSRDPLVPVVVIDDITEVSSTTTLDGAPFVSGTAVAAHGLHVLRIHAEDEAGLQSERTLQFEIDIAAPDATIVYPPPGTHVSAYTIDVLGRSEAFAQLELQVRGVVRHIAADADGAFVFAAVPLWAGDNTIRVRATDALGNVGAWTGTIVQRACGTAEQACSLFRDSFEPVPDFDAILRDGLEAGGRESGAGASPPAPDRPQEKRREAAIDRTAFGSRRLRAARPIPFARTH